MGQLPSLVHDVMPRPPPPGAVFPPLPELVVLPFPEPVDEPPFPEPVDEPPVALDEPPVEASEGCESPPQPLTRPTSPSVPTSAWRREVAIFGASKMRKAPRI